MNHDSCRSRIETSDFPLQADLRNGEVVYVVLKPDEDGLYEYSKVMLDRPSTGIFLRGRIQNRHVEWLPDQPQGNKKSYFRVNYGIEAFFAPRAKALELEEQLRDGAIARLMVSDEGKARLKDITES